VTPTYRADIDGLRAIAVLAVLLFHAGVRAFSGGFVGVNVFFVISGYLITTIIHREIEAGRFSITQFYERRFRRNLPAAAVLVVAVLVAGELLFPAHQQDGLARSAVAAALFSSNIFFYLESGYFADPAHSLPLLHTWSLAVEEQYYLLFPLVMLLIAKFGRRHYTAWLLLLTGVSFAACVRVTESDAAAAFYLSPTRAWELMVGSLLAVNAVPPLQSRRTRELVAIAGIAMLAVSVMGFSEFTIFPGFAALIPVLGTAMLIHSGAHGETTTVRYLSVRPLVFVGLISYSLYLWHWPVIVFAQYYSVVPLTPVATVLMFGVIFALAIASWRYVEMPFRRKRVAAARRQMFHVSTAATAAIVAVALVSLHGQGLPGRAGQDTAILHPEEDPEWLRWDQCEHRSRVPGGAGQPCSLGAGDETPSFMLWGASHARALASSVDRSAARNGLSGELAVASGCPPLSRVVRQDRRHCDAFNARVLEYLEAREDIGTVILAARWTFIVRGDYGEDEAPYALKLIDLQGTDSSGADNVGAFEAGLQRTVARLQALGKDVVLVGPVPEVG
jgi:peptidoglycan/LPS O-acetylase OafA/YrhL